MKVKARHLLARALGPLRARSNVDINIPPTSGIGLGNMLTYWFWAHRRREAGARAFVIRTDAMEPWLDIFPALRGLLMERSAIPFNAQRRHEMLQEFKESERIQQECFIRQYLLSSPMWPRTPPDEKGVVTVNVRRGDYYSEPEWKALYGFDIPSYVRVAIEGAEQQSPIEAVRVVSDGPDWCRENLAFLADFGHLEFQDPADGPVENLLQLSSASRLILANSSFSYWAAHMSNVWHGGNHAFTWAPWFHRRDFLDGAAWQLDPKWSIVRDIPGGW